MNQAFKTALAIIGLFAVITSLLFLVAFCTPNPESPQINTLQSMPTPPTDVFVVPEYPLIYLSLGIPFFVYALVRVITALLIKLYRKLKQ